MLLQDTEFELDAGFYLCNATADFDVDIRRGELRGVELVSVKLGSLTLDRSQLVDASSEAEIAAIEERFCESDEVANQLLPEAA